MNSDEHLQPQEKPAVERPVERPMERPAESSGDRPPAAGGPDNRRRPSGGRRPRFSPNRRDNRDNRDNRDANRDPRDARNDRPDNANRADSPPPGARDPQASRRPGNSGTGSVGRAIEQVENIKVQLRKVLDELQEVMDMLDHVEQQQTASEDEIEVLRDSLLSLNRDPYYQRSFRSPNPAPQPHHQPQAHAPVAPAHAPEPVEPASNEPESGDAPRRLE